MTNTLKQMLVASTAAFALVACAENEVETAQVERPAVAERMDIAAAPTEVSRLSKGEFLLSDLMDAGIVGADGDEFTDVEDIYIRDGRITSLSFDADAAFGGKRMVEFSEVDIVEGDIFDEIEVVIPRTEDSYDDFDLIDENVKLTLGDAGEEWIGRGVMYNGDSVEVEDVIFGLDGRVMFYVVDEGLGSDARRVRPSAISLESMDAPTAVLDDVDYDGNDNDDYETPDFLPERK